MVTIKIPQDTSFTFDIPGRYACNTLDEALESMDTSLADQADARPFDFIVIGGGSFGAALTARLFNLDRTHSHRILVLEAGPLVAGDQYTVRLGEAKDGQPTAFQEVTNSNKPPGKYQNRGLAPASDSSSGYIGIQAHTEKVAFRHIRVKPI